MDCALSNWPSSLWWPHPYTNWLGGDGDIKAEQQILFYLHSLEQHSGSGDGSTTFNVPMINDDRFIRGWEVLVVLIQGELFGSSQNVT